MSDARELVVLAHGMGRTPASMWMLGRTLRARGYRVLNWGYSSYTRPLHELGALMARDVAAAAGDAAKVHFVGHSLGTVITRWVLNHAPPPRVGRVVMLAPPNRGASKADRVMRYGSWLLPPLVDLCTTDSAAARTLPAPAGVDIGIIAGAEDRKVLVEETHLDGAAGHVVVPGGHTFIMMRPTVHRLVISFLETGTFA
jgi:pimeloyl-ACP methyl ester carboxylesterase